jgi:hypothetical protein
MPVTRELTPRARMEELAQILARGVLRWHAARYGDALETAPTCLAVPSQDRLSVPSGLRSREARPADVEHDAGED